MHIEERSSSVWRVRGQVPRKHTCVCSFCRPHSLVFLVRLRHCNKSKQIPCIISRPAVTDSKRRRVIFHSVHQSCCMNIHIHIYIYAIIVSRFHSVPESGTRVITTSSLKMTLLLQTNMLCACVYFSPVLDPELCYFPFAFFFCGRREQTQQTQIYYRIVLSFAYKYFL